MRAALVVILAALLASGCTYGAGRLSLVTTRYDLVPFEIVEREVVVRRCRFEWRFGEHPTVQEVVDLALAKAPGANALTNVVLQNSSYHWAWTLVLVDQNCLTLHGDAVRIVEP